MLPCYNKLTDDGLGEGTKKGLLHLQILGIHPEFQRRGLGLALVKHRLNQVCMILSMRAGCET
jgi:ribosomal protein S18 acetylase RimI-like enzyme